MEHCKLQLGCLVVVLYIVFIYYRGRRNVPAGLSHRLYEVLLAIGVICLALDGATAYTVNHLELIPPALNALLHCLFLISVDSVIFTLSIYVLASTDGLPKKRSVRLLLCLPFVVNILVVIGGIGSLEYRTGSITNYSMGFSAYTCFVMAAIYIISALVVLFSRWRYLERSKRLGIFTCLAIVACVTGYQMLVPESLLSCIATTMVILGAYVNHEDPAVQELQHYHDEMVMGFATLVENRDSNTGGHVRRTTLYVQLLAEALRERGHYRNILTKDYMKNLLTAAPMHDIGKIAIPDSILQKPGKLTDEEFEVMKWHTVRGGQIIQETFGRLQNAQYLDIAYQIALHHHEKWNGKGYPDGLAGKEIPLCARIMAIADVFDAVSEDRCYRAALPLDECFRIIAEGSGQDFDPLLAEVFLSIRPQVEAGYRAINAAGKGLPKTAP